MGLATEGNNDNIYVTEAFMPPKEEFDKLVAELWESKWITNNGKYCKELQEKLSTYLNAEHFHLVSNGTIALQLVFKALKLTGEIITTPYSYVATTSSLIWEGLTPVFADIEPVNFGIDPLQVEGLITPQTSAILATHVYGMPSNVEALKELADKHGLKLIFDCAHGFGVKYKNIDLCNYGDASTLSFHATKVFHTIEGGASIVRNATLFDDIDLLKSFGHKYDDYFSAGINAKISEFHAAMGLANYNHIQHVFSKRKVVWDKYHAALKDKYKVLELPEDLEYNYAYFPVFFDSEEQMLEKKSILENHNIYPRRYFYPSLNELPYLEQTYDCPVSEDHASRVLCLPLYPNLPVDKVELINELLL